MSLADAAHDYLQRGISLVPLKPHDKRPAGRWRQWQHERMPRATATSWWSGRIDPTPGMGIITGAISGGLTVLDVEPEHVAFVRDAITLPDTPTVETARGGLHIYCRGDARCGKLTVEGRPVGDVRGEGGYVVAPPTVIARGTYRWHDATRWQASELAPVPGWASPPPVAPIDSPPLPVLPPLTDKAVSSSIVDAIRGVTSAQGTFRSRSERDFAVMLELCYLGADFDVIEDLYDTAPIGTSYRETRIGTDYLYRTYRAVQRTMAAQRAGSILVRARALHINPGNIAQRCATLRVSAPRDSQLYFKSLPVVLANGDLAGEWLQLCRGFGQPPVQPPIKMPGLARAVVRDRTLVRLLDRSLWG